MADSERLRVVVATPLKDEDRLLIERAEPRVEMVQDASLLPPMRWAADFDGDPDFQRTAAQTARFCQLIDSADVLYGIPDVQPAQLARAVRANPKLRWVQIMAAGGGAQVKAAGLTQLELERVIFTTGAGVHAGPLAEFAIFGLFAGAKNLPRLQAQKTTKTWSGRWPMNQVSQQTVLVVGLGHIGREVARKAAALGARVVGVDLYVTDAPGVDQVFRPDQLAQAASGADAVVNTLPGTESTLHLIDRAVLGRLNRGATAVSVGRGSVYDEAALIEALESGQIGFAALDVFDIEPLPAASPLWTMPNVVISPHTAANSPAEERLLAELFADNARRLLDGQPLRNQVNTVEFF